MMNDTLEMMIKINELRDKEKPDSREYKLFTRMLEYNFDHIEQTHNAIEEELTPSAPLKMI